jgi:hypothetical protein
MSNNNLIMIYLPADLTAQWPITKCIRVKKTKNIQKQNTKTRQFIPNE